MLKKIRVRGKIAASHTEEYVQLTRRQTMETISYKMSVSDLPDDIIFCICRILSLADVLVISRCRTFQLITCRACKKFHQTLSDEKWKFFCILNWKQNQLSTLVFQTPVLPPNCTWKWFARCLSVISVR